MMKIWPKVVFTGLLCCTGFPGGGVATNPQADTTPSLQTVHPGQESNTGVRQGSVSAPTPELSPADAASSGDSPEALSMKAKATQLLYQKNFSYNSELLPDPFIPFIKVPESPPEVPIASEDDEALPPEIQRPLTPLQKMTIGEIERGLKAIVWGGLGRKAIIQDSAGKGYIVGVGTAAGGSSGVITRIFNDRLVIQQQVWDKDRQRLIPRNAVISLRKQTER